MKKLLWLLVFWQSVASGQQHPYKLIAYSTGNADNIKQYPIDKLTHIIYSFLRLKQDTLDFSDEQQRATVMELVELKKSYPGLKIMVSIGGWGGCAPCSELFASELHRNNFAETTVALFDQYNIDGLDLDWEYPAIEGYPGHAYNSSDRNNFTKLVNTLRDKMGTKYILSFAAGGFIDYLKRSIDWDAVMPKVDFVNLMTYDLVGGYSKVTGHHTPLKDYRPGQESTQKCVNWLLKHKVKKEQLIIGAAVYARVWEQVQPENNGLYQAGSFKQGVSFKDFKSYFSDSSGYIYFWDKKAEAPYQYNPVKKLFATFDDERSIRAKTEFIQQKKLGGIMFWQLLDDKTSGGLVDAISLGLSK